MPQVKEKVATDMSLPELMGSITQRILTVLEQGDTATKQSTIGNCRNDLRSWYESQPSDKRKEMAKDYKRIMQNYKNVAEQLNFDLVSLTAQDS